jgi:Na+-driven multidrug efflux pump
VKIALPVSFQNIFTLTGFLVFIAITGLIGTLQQAASQITVSAMFLSLMPSFGFGIAAQTFVGNKLGQNNVPLAKFYGFETSKIATAYTIFIGIIFVLFPKIILSALTKQNNIIELAIPILRIAGFAQVFFGVGIVLASGLQSAGESFFVMMSDIIVNWVIFIPLAYILGVVMHFGIIGAWSVMPLYTVLYAIMIFLKFKYGKWVRYKD